MGISLVRNIEVVAPVSGGVATSQTGGAAGALELNGSLVAAGVATIASDDTVKRVALTASGDASGVNFTIEGTDGIGALSETVTGPNIGTVDSLQYFRTITRISFDAAFPGTVEVGTDSNFASDWLELSRRQTLLNVGIGVKLVTGTVTWGLEHTWQVPSELRDTVLDTFPHDSLTNQSTDADGNYVLPISAFRLFGDSGACTMRVYAQQASMPF